MKMSKLYELLAVESDLRQQANEELKRVKEMFAQGGVRFVGQTISFHPVQEGADEVPDEYTELASTVDDELELLAGVFGNYLNVTIQKEVANTNTEAESEEFDFLNGLPAPALLNLESRLEDLKKVYELIPTLDPSERWEFDNQRGCFVSDLRVAFRTAKVPKSFVAYEATKEHPAQVQVFNEDVPTHRRETMIYSGALTVADKRDRLERISILISQVKKARQRANDVEITPDELADRIFGYINS